MATRVSARKAVRSFSDLLDWIRYRGEEFVVERAGETICHMTPVLKSLTLRGLVSLLREVPKADAGYASDVRRAARCPGRLQRSPWGR